MYLAFLDLIVICTWYFTVAATVALMTFPKLVASMVYWHHCGSHHGRMALLLDKVFIVMAGNWLPISPCGAVQLLQLQKFAFYHRVKLSRSAGQQCHQCYGAKILRFTAV